VTLLARHRPGERLSARRTLKGEQGLGQRTFREHAIRDETDLGRHLHDIHDNSVRHGCVRRAAD
jgi:putative transposase